MSVCFDAHSDLLWDVDRRRRHGETHVLERLHRERLEKGGVEGLMLAVWANQTPVLSYGQHTEQILAAAEAERAECPWLAAVRTAAEAEEARAAGKLYAFFSVEGMAAAGEDPAYVDRYAAFGVRAAMLTWNEENALATGAGGDPAKGLTEAGKHILRRLGERGILLDVSHLNVGGFRDAVRLAEGPVIASHSNCRALCDVPRNLTDDQLRAIRDTGGVVGLNSYHEFVHMEPTEQTVLTLALHAAHMAEVMGTAHIGCGFDFCEFMGDPSLEGVEDASQIPNFVYWLERVGFDARERQCILRENFLRILA